MAEAVEVARLRDRLKVCLTDVRLGGDRIHEDSDSESIAIARDRVRDARRISEIR